MCNRPSSTLLCTGPALYVWALHPPPELASLPHAERNIGAQQVLLLLVLHDPVRQQLQHAPTCFVGRGLLPGRVMHSPHFGPAWSVDMLHAGQKQTWA